MNTLKSYLYTAVRNRSFNYLRDEKRRSIREAQFLNNLKAEEEGYNSALENEIYRQLKLLLEELPEQCKNIFQRTLSGDTSEKIAADLKLSVETVKTQRKKAKRILRERYTLIFVKIIFLPFKYPFLLQAVSYYKKRLNNLWTHQSPGRSQT